MTIMALAVAAGVLASVAVLVTLVAHAAVRRALARPAPEPDALPPISVLKPVRGVDDGLYDNLAAIARQDHPRFEVIVGAADVDDPALAVARRVQADHPDVPIRIVAGAPALGLNPKVQNLAHITGLAHHDHLLVSDSNVRPGSGYLRALASDAADPEVGLVHNPITGIGERRLGAALDNLHLSAWVTPAVCAAQRWSPIPCVVGKSMLVSRRALAAIGGWASVKDVLAEDHLIGRRIARAGYRVALSSHPVPAVSTTQGIGAFFARHVRWGQMRRRIAPAAYAGELVFNPVPLSAVAAAAATVAGASVAVCGVALAAVAGLKIAADCRLARCLRGRPVALAHAAAIPIKDVLIAAAWIVAAVRRDVTWRGHRMRIGPGSELSPARARAALAPARERA